MHLRSTFKYPAKGTYIIDDRISDPELPITGIAGRNGFCSFNIEFHGLNDVIGVAADILIVFKNRQISTEFITTGIDDISIILSESQLDSTAVSEIIRELGNVSGTKASVSFTEHLGSLVIAGKSLPFSKGIAGNIQQTLSRAGIVTHFLLMGPSKRCIIFGISSCDHIKALNAVYEEHLK